MGDMCLLNTTPMRVKMRSCEMIMNAKYRATTARSRRDWVNCKRCKTSDMPIPKEENTHGALIFREPTHDEGEEVPKNGGYARRRYT